MGVWGAGLYSGDFAMDLRSTISAVARLPLDSDKLVDILCETEPRAANNPDDEAHTSFWLIVADQFAKRGIVCDRARDKALTIIDAGSDIAMHDKLGMSPSDLRKRRKMLEAVRVRLTASKVSSKPRLILKRPQVLLMAVGDVFVYPTFDGECINPYYGLKEQGRYARKGAMTAWKQNGWSALVIVDCGRAFDFLSWYRPLTISPAAAEKPTLEGLRDAELLWKLARAGTCSAVHLRRMELEKIGTPRIDNDKLRSSFPGMRPGISAAVSDISLANTLNVGPAVPAVKMPRPGEPLNFCLGRPYSTILGLEQILATRGSLSLRRTLDRFWMGGRQTFPYRIREGLPVIVRHERERLRGRVVRNCLTDEGRHLVCASWRCSLSPVVGWSANRRAPG